MSILKLIKRFPTQDSCIKHLEKVRWGKTPICVYCNSSKTSIHNGKDKHSNRRQCQSCKKSFSVTVGTIFHNTKLDIRKWFYIISLMMDARKGVSSCQVARDLNMRQATVWSVMHRVRLAMNENEQREMIRGIFEMDEAVVETQNNDKDDKGGKSQLAAIKEKGQGGKIRVEEVTNTTHFTLLNVALQKADYGSEIHTDGYSSL